MFNSIRWRLTFLMIVLAILPIVALGGFIIYQEFHENQTEAHELQSEIALRVARETQTYIEARPRDLQLVAEIRGLVNLSLDEQRGVLTELLGFDRANPIFDELALIDPNGQEFVRVSRRAVVVPGQQRDRSLDETFQLTRNRRTVYYSPVRFDYETGEPLMSIGLPLFDPRTGEITSVMTGEFRLRSVWDLIAAQDFGPGEDLYVVTIAADLQETLEERVIAHRNPSVVLSGTIFNTHGLKEVDTGVNGDQVILAVQTFAAGENQFAVVAEVTTEEAYREIYENLMVLTAGLAIIMLLAGLTGYLVLRRMTTPIVTLADAAKRLGAGDLTVQVESSGRTEIGTLARSFNTMAQQLREVFGTLEARVQARTRDLQLAAQVSEQMATILDPEHLLPQVVELTKANFDLYHAHIYLMDNTGQGLVLAAGAGEAGRVMKAQGHRIPMEARSLAARAARDRTPNIVNDVRQEPDFLPNPLLPDTRAEAAIPLIAGDRVLGVLDVQSNQPGRFETDILAVLSTLAGQITVALDNARLFSEVARASRHERTLSDITQEIQRANSLDEVLQAATRELGKALRVPHTRIQLQLPEMEPEPVDEESVEA